MTSAINYTGIDPTFPVAGQDNDSQGFRDNFGAIQTALETAKTEITGSNQQTTSNIEYRDIGVSLSITPLIGEQDIITLDIAEEITEATPNLFASTHGVQGIQTTKPNMVTKAHVPDQHWPLAADGANRDTSVARWSAGSR